MYICCVINYLNVNSDNLFLHLQILSEPGWLGCSGWQDGLHEEQDGEGKGGGGHGEGKGGGGHGEGK